MKRATPLHRRRIQLRIAVAADPRMARCRSVSLGRCLPTRHPSQTGGTACYLAEVSREQLRNAIRSILGVLATKRSAPANNLDAAAQVTSCNVEPYIAGTYSAGAVGHSLELHLQTAPRCRAAGADVRLLPGSPIDRERPCARDGAKIEVRSTGFTGNYCEVGGTLVAEAQGYAKNDRQSKRFAQRSLRLHFSRSAQSGREFRGRKFGHTFKEVHGSW